MPGKKEEQVKTLQINVEETIQTKEHLPGQNERVSTKPLKKIIFEKKVIRY